MQVPLLDLKAQFQTLREAILPEVERLIESQQFILGPRVESFEEAVCRYTGAPHAVGVSSGTDALLMALMALEIGPGDAVLTTPFSFFATAGSIARLGATPAFVDIDPLTFNLSVEHLRRTLADALRDTDGHPLARDGKRIRAIMPVHLYGLCAEMDAIGDLAQEYGLPIIEDAAQALGSTYPSRHGPRQAGAIGDFGCYSFFPSKNLGAFGDGGMVVCRDAAAAQKLRALRNHGGERRYYHPIIGGNFRLDALQATVLEIKLPHLDAWSAARRRNTALYREAFENAGLFPAITFPAEPYRGSGHANHHIFNQFVLRVPERDALCAALESAGIGHAIYYPLPLHLQECFNGLGHREGDFPEAERAARETIALPVYPELAPEQIARVVETLARFYARR